MTNEQRREYGKDFERINRKFEVAYFPKVQKAIKTKISSLTSVIKQSGIEAGRNYVSTDLANAELSSTVKQLYTTVGLRHARKEYRRQRAEVKANGSLNFSHKQLVLVSGKEVSTSPPFFETKGAFGFNEQWVTFILQYLQQFLIEKITFDVQKTLRDKLLDILQTGIAEGWSIDQMVKELEGSPFTKVQAARIVRTEINRAANVGTMAAVDTSEYEMNKEWIAAHDRRTRGNPFTGQKDHANHWDLDGKVIGFDEAFTDERSGDELQFPGDPKASAASTINCRCSVAPVAKRDENGRLVPKAQPSVMAPVLGILRPPIAASPHIGLRVGGRR